MKRRLAGVLAVVVAIVAAIIYLQLRGGDKKSFETAPIARGSGSAIVPKPKAPDEAPPPQRPAQKWTLDTDPEGPLVLEGQVLGPDGKGVSKARVAITSVPPRSVTADDDGTFSIDKLVARTYQLTASATDLVGGPVFYKLRDGGDPVVIHMSAGAAVDVTVVDDQQKPMKGATVKLGDQSERTAETNAEGKATLGPVQPGWVAVSASAPGYANGGGLTTIGSAGVHATITIAMKKGVAVSGKVVDESGAPVAKARVIAQGPPGWGGGGREPDAETTNDKGEFAFAALAAGTTKLIAMDGEHAPSASEPVKIGSAPVTGVTITMTPGGVIAGKVVDTENKPVPFATVRIAGAGRAQAATAARQTTTDKTGAFEVRGLSRLTLQARAESEIAASKLVPIDLTQKPRMDDVTLTLDVTGTIAGIVVDEKGKPVPEVSVNAYPDMLAGAKAENAALAGFSSATTDGEGKFVIRGLPDDQYRLWATRAFGADGGSWSRNSTPARVGEQNARLELPTPGGLEGKVALDGEPPKHATVQVGFGAPTPIVKGEFFIQDLAPGTYDVTLHSLEFSERIIRDVEVKPADTTDLGTISVEKGRILRGEVVDGSGNPVAGAKIRVGERLFSATGDEAQVDQWDALANVRSGFSGADGTFTIIGIPDKQTSAAAENSSGRSLPVTVPAAGNPPSIKLTIKGFGSIAGKVTRNGQPVPGVAVDEVVKGMPSQNSFAQTREDGTFTLERVVEGTHVVTANERRQMTGRGGAVTVQVTAGKTTTANIDIPSGDLSLEVTIKPAAGAKVDSAQMFLFGGSVNVDNGQALVDKTLDGGSVFMRFWFTGKPPTVFDEMAAGTYSLCSIPITGDMNSPTFMQRIQENIPALNVVCTPVTIKAAPAKQSILQELPSMSPLPPPS
jgi:uncharacterized GH25 family protein